MYSAPLALDGPPVRLGSAHVYVPSATAGRMWLAGVDCDRGTMVGVREVTVDGRVTVESRRRVPGSWVAAAVREGLVVQRGRRLSVWDPRTGRTVRRLRLEAVTETRGDLMLGCTGSLPPHRGRRRGDRPHRRRARPAARPRRQALARRLAAGHDDAAAPPLERRARRHAHRRDVDPPGRADRAHLPAGSLGGVERLALHPRPRRPPARLSPRRAARGQAAAAATAGGGLARGRLRIPE